MTSPLLLVATALVATALHDAAWSGDVDKVRQLLDHDAAINARTPESGSTPLDYAVVTNHLAVAQMLLHSGAKINAALTLAASRGYTDITKLLLDSGAPVTSAPLEEAAKKGHTEVVQLLLEHHADPLPALRNAVLKGEQAMVRILAPQAPDLNRKSPAGTAPLHDAALRNYPEIAAILLTNGALPDPRDNYGATPLHTAALKGHADLARLLIEHGANVNARETDSGSTPLYAAASLGHADVVKLLLGHAADPALLNKAGHDAAYAATQNGFPEIARILARKGAENPWN
jgi:ankyrin repeat protein